MEEIKKKMREDFRSRFGRFYVSIDSKTKAIRIVDIENGTKVNGEDGSLIECVASNDIEKFIDSIIDLAVSKERERVTSKTDEVWDLLCQMDTNIKSEKEYAKDIINLINTK